MSTTDLLHILRLLKNASEQQIRMVHEYVNAIDFEDDCSGKSIDQFIELFEKLSHEEQEVARAVIDLLINFLDTSSIRAKSISSGNIELKMLKKKRKDVSTGEIREIDYGPYAYIRIWDHDRKTNKRKLRSIYLGKEIASALESNLITEKQILDAYHNGKIDEFKKEILTLVNRKEK